METNKDIQKKEKEKKVYEIFKETSFKEKLIIYIILSFTSIIFANLSYITSQIINNEYISLSTMFYLTILAPVAVILYFTFFVHYNSRYERSVEKIQRKYGISDLKFVIIVMIFFGVMVAVAGGFIIPLYKGYLQLSIAQFVAVTFFAISLGILLIFLLKKYVFKSN